MAEQYNSIYSPSNIPAQVSYSLEYPEESLDEDSTRLSPNNIKYWKKFKELYRKSKKDRAYKPKFKGKPSDYLVDLLLHGKDARLVEDTFPILTNYGVTRPLYNSAQHVIRNGVDLSHSPVSIFKPKSLAFNFKHLTPASFRFLYGLGAAGAASTGLDVGLNVYDSVIRDRQEALHKSKEYNDKWRSVVQKNTDAATKAIDYADMGLGPLIYGKNWSARNRKWGERAGYWMSAIPMGHSDMNEIIDNNPEEFWKSVALESAKEPGKWADWFVNTGREIRDGNGFIGTLTNPRLATNGIPWMTQNLYDGLGIPGYFFNPSREPRSGIKLNDYDSMIESNVNSNNKEGLKRTALALYENRPLIQNSNAQWAIPRSAYWYINNVGLNPFNWFNNTQVPPKVINPELDKSVNERFRDLSNEADTFKGSVAPHLPEIAGFLDDIVLAVGKEPVDRAVLSSWEALEPEQRAFIQQQYPDKNIEAIMRDPEQRIKWFYETNMNVRRALSDSYKNAINIKNKGDNTAETIVSKLNNKSKQEGPSIGALEPSKFNPWTNNGEAKEDRYFDFSNPDYRFVKPFYGRSEWLPFAPLVNTLTKYPLSATRDAINLGEERIKETFFPTKTWYNAKPVKPAPPPLPNRQVYGGVTTIKQNGNYVDRKDPTGTVIRTDKRLPVNSSQQVF